MKCNPWRWLFGLIPLALLASFALIKERSPVEADLTKRATEALKKGGFNWASVRIDGRDAYITGKAIDETHPPKAVQAVYDLWGVRNAISSIGLIDKIDKYEWLAVLRNKELQLGGFVPNEKLRRDILNQVRTAFPGHKVDDKMQYGRTDIPLDAWFGGVGFALKQLAQMKQGEAKLERTSLTVSGEANTVAMYRGLRTALEKGLPKGVNLKQEAVRPPVVKPYLWLAKHDGRQVTLTGFAPNERVRSEILADAKRAFPKATVTDRMEPGDGAPANFQYAVRGLLLQLARLEEGEADIKDSVVSVTGLAEGIERANEVRGSLRQAVGPSYRVTDQIKHREPVIANVSPYTTSITVGRGVVVLRGYAPTDDARRAVVGQAAPRFAPKTIANQLDIGSGAPSGWQRCIDMAVVALHRLGNGKAELIDGRLTLTGETEAEDLAQSLAGVVRDGVGGNCDVDVRVTLNLANKLKAEEEARRKAAAEEEARRRANLDREAALRAEAEARRRAEEAARARAAEAARKQATVCVDGLRQLAREGVLLFERASSVISTSSYPTLNRIAEAANRCPDVRIEIQGHTDTDGAPDRNQRLSERRAQAVAAYLVQAGVASSRMSAIGFGQDRPVAPNDTPENMARNRRIEFTVKAN